MGNFACGSLMSLTDGVFPVFVFQQGASNAEKFDYVSLSFTEFSG